MSMIGNTSAAERLSLRARLPEIDTVSSQSRAGNPPMHLFSTLHHSPKLTLSSEALKSPLLLHEKGSPQKL
jgi:hypothetical protein